MDKYSSHLKFCIVCGKRTATMPRKKIGKNDYMVWSEIEGKMNVLEGRINGRKNALEGKFDSMETTMEELKVEMRGVHQELQEITHILGRRTRNQDRSSKGSRVGRKEISEDNIEENRGENVTEKERIKLAYIFTKGGASYWFRFWEKKTNNPT
ncbi:hypothetical protein V8G54_031640 [Vigna mungo]|uniref:Uncharacterized protein n=1 Tax=Vigna mungo TaxID=3915 RepID=A0AAQ3MK16_VIGMU